MSYDWNLPIVLNYIIPSTDRVCFIPSVSLIVTPPPPLRFVTVGDIAKSSDVLLAIHGRQPFPSSAIQQVMPSINQYLFSELQYKIMLNNKYVHITSTNDI